MNRYLYFHSLYLFRRVLLHGPTPPFSGHLMPLVLILPTHLSAICNLHSLLQPGISNQPAPVHIGHNSTHQDQFIFPVLLVTLFPSSPRLSLCLPAAEPLPVWLPACRRVLAGQTACLSPNPCSSDYPPVAESLPAWLTPCYRTLACLTTACLAPACRLPHVPINPTSFHSVSASLVQGLGPLVLSLNNFQYY